MDVVHTDRRLVRPEGAILSVRDALTRINCRLVTEAGQAAPPGNWLGRALRPKGPGLGPLSDPMGRKLK